MASKLTLLFLYLGFFIHFIYAVPERGIKDMVFDAVMLLFISFFSLYLVSVALV